MSCGLLNTKLDAAYAAAREAFDEAHKTDALADNDLNLLFVYYQGIKKLKESLPSHDHDEIVNVQDIKAFNFSHRVGCHDACIIHNPPNGSYSNCVIKINRVVAHRVAGTMTGTELFKLDIETSIIDRTYWIRSFGIFDRVNASQSNQLYKVKCFSVEPVSYTHLTLPTSDLV